MKIKQEKYLLSNNLKEISGQTERNSSTQKYATHLTASHMGCVYVYTEASHLEPSF